MLNNLIIVNNSLGDVKTTFKWMWEPKKNIILISSGMQQHKFAWKTFYDKNKEIEPFENWIRFIHLSKDDYKNNRKRRILCVRIYEESLVSKDIISSLIRRLGIKSRIVFDITNEKIIKITDNFTTKY